jgi:ribosome-binding protein aMBF1 (putative translation factor)
MAKTSDALEILRRRAQKDPELEALYEEESLNFQVALMIRELRQSLGLSQGELAQKVKTTQSVISRLEDADYEGHSLSMLQRIAKALNRKIVIRMEPMDRRAA